MMNCEQVTRAAGDFLERKLKLRDRMSILLHIAMCPGCRVYVEQMRLTILGLRSLNQPLGAGPGVESLLDCYRDEIRRKDS